VQRLTRTSFQRGVYPAEDFTAVKKYGLTMLVSSDDQVKAYIKKIMSQLDKWMVHGKISKLVVVITSKDTGEHVERWQFDVQIFNKSSKKGSKGKAADKENAVPEYVSSPLLFPYIFANEEIGVIPPP
jgi:mitotic spindle assembly checkpoint protein MAD2